MEQAEATGAQGNYVCALHSEGGNYRQFFSLRFSRQSGARSRLLPGLPWEVQPKVNGLPRSLFFLRPRGHRANSRRLNSFAELDVSTSAPVATFKKCRSVLTWVWRVLLCVPVYGSVLPCVHTSTPSLLTSSFARVSRAPCLFLSSQRGQF